MTQAAARAQPAPAPEAAPGPIDHAKRMPSFDYMTMMREIAQSGGKSYFAQTREMYELKHAPGKIAPVEYFHYGLYDDALSKAEKRVFVGVTLRADVNKLLLNREYFGLGKDKIAFYAFAAGVGLFTPQTRALYHPSRRLAGAAQLYDAAAFAAFLRDSANYPFFSKPANLTASVGVASAERYIAEADEIEFAGGARFPVARFVEEAQRYFAGGYLIQQRLAAHPLYAAIAGPQLSTIRFMVLADEGAPKVIRTTWRIPAGGKTADVMWRGNMMGAIDPDTGIVKRVVQGRGLERKLIDAHPQTGAALVGAEMPLWRECCALALDAARSVPKLALTGWDIAVCETGPAVIELEPDGGDPAVTQLASGEGLLSGPYGAWLGRNKDKLKPKKR
jgi:hypothetical protein